MSTLPTLPACGAPATIRIELYTGDSLDACAYTCAMHLDQTTAASARAGLDAHPAGAAGLDRHCGYVHVYQTGALADATPTACPRWCDRDDCKRRGHHRSRAHHLDTNRLEAFIIDVGLVQALHQAAEPMVSLTGVESSAAANLALSMRQARVLRYRLSHLLDIATAVRNGGRWA
ncbi:hypothetical protein AB0J85_29645 [Micromonospora echinofusca]|uniref:hypothetical protein n=1 Tax=Micromonospora echinofusca TaxID=47858 RepID=UPI003419C092